MRHLLAVRQPQPVGIGQLHAVRPRRLGIVLQQLALVGAAVLDREPAHDQPRHVVHRRAREAQLEVQDARLAVRLEEHVAAMRIAMDQRVRRGIVERPHLVERVADQLRLGNGIDQPGAIVAAGQLLPMLVADEVLEEVALRLLPAGGEPRQLLALPELAVHRRELLEQRRHLIGRQLAPKAERHPARDEVLQHGQALLLVVDPREIVARDVHRHVGGERVEELRLLLQHDPIALELVLVEAALHEHHVGRVAVAAAIGIAELEPARGRGADPLGIAREAAHPCAGELLLQHAAEPLRGELVEAVRQAGAGRGGQARSPSPIVLFWRGGRMWRRAAQGRYRVSTPA